MSKPQTVNKVAKNMALSLSAQVISLCVSFLMGFIVPKFIDGYQYAYWQTYLLYVGYVGIFHFGLLDGIVLRYSKYDYDEIDRGRVRSQFQLLLTGCSLIFLVGCLIAFLTGSPIDRHILVLVAAGVITKNIFSYTSFSFQITNRISYYALIVMVQRLAYALVIVGLIFGGVNNFLWFCVADLVGDLVGTLLGAVFNRGMYFGKSLSPREALKEARTNMAAGIFLTIANFSSIFLLGGAKMVSEWRFDELTFGKIAFAFSLTNIFLTCIAAVSVVLFPSLKRMQEAELPDLYGKIRGAISPLLFVVLLLYFPMCFVLRRWLPNYTESLTFLGVLLPIVIFASKVNLLTNNYLKAYRREKSLLAVNAIAIAIGFSLFLLSAYIFQSLDLLLFSVVFISIGTSVASELLVSRIIHRRFIRDMIIEFLMAAVFIAAARYISAISLLYGLLAYLAATVIYFILYRKTVMSFLSACIRKLKRKGAGT